MLNFLYLIILVLLSSCSSLKSNKKDTINNFVDRKNNDNVNKVITLTSLSTDIVSKISSNKLVGIPESSLFKNNSEFISLPIISKGRTPPNLEKIISLQPDLVIGSKGFHNNILNKLEDINIQTFSYELNDWDSLEKNINLISSKLGINDIEKSREIINRNLKECLVNNESTNKVNVVVLASTKPILSPNSKSWAGNLLKRFDLNNLTKDLDSKSEFRGYVNLSPEWLVKEDPDKLIVIQTRPGQYIDIEKTKPFSNLRAVKTKQVYKFNYYGLINAGSLKSINNTCFKLRQML
tara:strand:- start:3522 stop:4403 length:882 start_codon:yes stop_codon:yes gene_type:complete